MQRKMLDQYREHAFLTFCVHILFPGFKLNIIERSYQNHVYIHYQNMPMQCTEIFKVVENEDFP